MSFYVHPKATVHLTAVIRPGAWIGPNVVIEKNAVIGHYSVIGGPPEHSKYYDDLDGDLTKGVHIGAGVRVFEFVTIQAGTERQTQLMCGAAVFQHSHVSHDCVVGPLSTIAGRASLAGFVNVGKLANVGAHAIVHQHCVIGAMAMIGMGSVLKSHVCPGQTWAGYPAKWIGINEVGLQRAKITLDQLLDFEAAAFKKLTEESRL